MIKAGSPEDMNRMMARLDADEVRPIDDSSMIQDFPKYGRPLVQVGAIYGKAVAWSRSSGLIEWLDASGKYHLGWAQPASIKRVWPEEWKGRPGWRVHAAASLRARPRDPTPAICLNRQR